MERMQMAKSVLAGVMVAAVTICAIAATLSDPHSLSQKSGRASVAGRALSAVTHFQSLVDESTVLSAQNGTEDSPAPRVSGPKPKINSNEEMDMEGQRWMMEHPQEAQTAAIIWNIGLLLLLGSLISVLYSEVNRRYYTFGRHCHTLSRNVSTLPLNSGFPFSVFLRSSPLFAFPDGVFFLADAFNEKSLARR